jgi:hypothetical protein
MAYSIGEGGEMLPVGCWFCPICRKEDRKKVRQIMGVSRRDVGADN